MARDAGLDAWTSPTRHGPAVWTRENQIMSIIRETGAVLWYQYHRIVGSDVDFPG
ncbi:MAG: YdcF family protein, partial [Dietzia sp.]|nr:YdcF family protein [Dietzia sp.]